MRYIFYCESCEARHEIIRPMARHADPAPCPLCHQEMGRDHAAEEKGLNEAALKFGRKYPYVSNRLPRNLDGCRHTPDGKPVIENARHEANIASRHGYRRE